MCKYTCPYGLIIYSLYFFRPLNARERCLRSAEILEVISPREIVTRHTLESKLTKKFTFDRAFGPDSKQVDVYKSVVAPLIDEVLSGYNCTVFAYGQTGTGKTHTMVGNQCAELKSSCDDVSISLSYTYTYTKCF